MSSANDQTRKLSFFRVLLTLIFLAAAVYSSMTKFRTRQEKQSVAGFEPWFAAYVDVTAIPSYAFEQVGPIAAPQVVLSFIVSSPDDACLPSWGAYHTLDEAATVLDLDRRIARLQQQGGKVAISFGGALNHELALDCRDQDKLLKAYQSVIERYNIDTIDLDLENSGLTDLEAGKRRAQVIAQLQKTRREQGESLAVWLTLPVAPQGLTVDGTNAVAQMLANSVDLSGVNVMTMDYGGSKTSNQSMFEASKQALIQTHRQLGILYTQAGITLNNATLWRKLGATPMIGQNDVREEVFTLEDAEKLNTFALAQGVGRMSMWSANRDLPCGENYVDLKLVSDSCSGVTDSKLSFTLALSKDFSGNLTQNSTIITIGDSQTKVHEIDDPDKSPYQIWQEEGTYLEGAKVVWHGNVYEAKWWTRGDLPDNPVLQSWETPWTLIGPVLEGEKPIAQPTLPEGTYPEWSGEVAYEAGQLVLFDSVPYRAKWWNQGESPAQSSLNAHASAWMPLSERQVQKLLEEIEGGI